MCKTDNLPSPFFNLFKVLKTLPEILRSYQEVLTILLQRSKNIAENSISSCQVDGPYQGCQKTENESMAFFLESFNQWWLTPLSTVCFNTLYCLHFPC